MAQEHATRHTGQDRDEAYRKIESDRLAKAVAEHGHQNGQPELGAPEADQSAERATHTPVAAATVGTRQAFARDTIRVMATRARPHATGPSAGHQRVRSNILAAPARSKVWIELNGRFVIGEGGVRLLVAIHETGSLAAALRQIGWSYRHGWGYLRRAEEALGEALTRSRPGKGSARGTELTPAAAMLVKRLLRLRRQVDRLIGPSGPTAGEIAARGRDTHRR
jgi:molybdate transport system regulatory protein